MQKVLTLIVVSIVLTAGALMRNLSPPPATLTAADAAGISFRRDVIEFTAAARRLHMTVTQMNPGISNSRQMLAALQNCRIRYKKIESFLSCFFPGVAAGINGPPVYEGEEPFMEYQEPRGLQVIESLLTDKSRPPDRQRLLQESTLLSETSVTLPALMYDFSATDADIMQSLRLGLIRISTLGITGYDAPQLKTGLVESAVVAEGIVEQLRFFPGSDELVRLAQQIARRLETAGDFDRFDRLKFIKTAVIPFQEALKSYCKDRGMLLPESGLLRSGETNIFTPHSLRPAAVLPSRDALVSLGRKWFSDKTLSRRDIKSCASCHNPAKAFTDGLPVSPGIVPGKPLKRNAPTLLYSAYQYRQFWDGRATGLAAQILTVLHDPFEMDIDTLKFQRRWETDTAFRERVAGAFPDLPLPSPSEMICFAVGAYVNTLGGFSSDFDRYLQGDDTLMNADARNGFNLFMGKARCGTCHFAPVFNGTLPPGFDRTEFEITGTTNDADFRHPVLSSDIGRYGVYPLPFNRFSFKTTTVRNAAQTGPYMHNGRFKTLEEVIIFYNNGGGAGMGLSVPGQTLSADSLHLSDKEMKDIISFIYTLNDKPEGAKQ